MIKCAKHSLLRNGGCAQRYERSINAGRTLTSALCGRANQVFSEKQLAYRVTTSAA